MKHRYPILRLLASILLISFTSAQSTGTGCTCSGGFQVNMAGNGCEQITTVDATFTGQLITSCKAAYDWWYGHEGAHFPGGLIANPYFGQPGNTFQSRLNTIGVWACGNNPNNPVLHPRVGERIGFSRCIDIAQDGEYVVGLAADDRMRFFVDGNPVFLKDKAEDWDNFLYWWMIGIPLTAGSHIIQMEGYNTQGPASFGAEIYGPFLAGSTANDASMASLDYRNNVIWSTGDQIGQSFVSGTTSGYSCPGGGAVDTCSSAKVVCTTFTKQECATGNPSVEPSASPTTFPSTNSTIKISDAPTIVVSVIPTVVLSASPTLAPSIPPTAVPSIAATATPSSTPTIIPTANPSDIPSMIPSLSPSVSSSTTPSTLPSTVPSAVPSEVSSFVPSRVLSQTPSTSATPSIMVSGEPSGSAIPSPNPSVQPSLSVGPSVVASHDPSSSVAPSFIVSGDPSGSMTPSLNPSSIPSVSVGPSDVPTGNPSGSMAPSMHPSHVPSIPPTVVLSAAPTLLQSVTPTGTLSNAPTILPTDNPTIEPSRHLSVSPTRCTCSGGFQVNMAGNGCEQTTTVDATFTGQLLASCKARYDWWYGHEGAHFPGGLIVANPYFGQPGNTFQSRLNTIGVWACGDNLNNQALQPRVGEWIGFSRCIDIAQDGEYVVGLAADDRMRFFVDGNPVFLKDKAEDWDNFLYWWMVGIPLTAGSHIIQMEGYNTQGPASFGAEIYGPFLAGSTANDASMASLDYRNNVIWSTGDQIGQSFVSGTTSGYSCPGGGAVDTCSSAKVVCKNFAKEECR